jgi:hypothetical protein
VFYATDSIRDALKGIDSKFGWLRGLDLNQRPLDYEQIHSTAKDSELAENLGKLSAEWHQNAISLSLSY